jgi:membrane-bound serine protease (ClpP class)
MPRGRSPSPSCSPRLAASAALVLWSAFVLAQGAVGRTPGFDPAVPRTLPELPQSGRVTRVAIDESVEPGLAAFVKRVVEEHREGETVLLEINTLGGRLDAALTIRDALLASKARTVCWVKPRAISAGALIALSCDIVVLAPGASMGAATPVQVGPSGGITAVDAKVVSYMRQEMASTARMQQRNPLVAEAMVDLEVEIPGLIDGAHLLTLDTEKALEFGLADLRAADEAELWKVLGRDSPRVEQARPTGPEALARFLSDPTVAVALMILGIAGIAVEIFNPMQGTAMLFGIFCLGLFFLGHNIVNLAGWVEVALLGLGVVFLALEFAFPGHVFGVVGLKLILIGLFLALVSLDRLPVDVAWSSGLLPRALATVMGSLLGAVALIVAVLRYAPRTRHGRSLVLDAVVPTPAPSHRGIALDALVGEVGVALTDLRPIGRIEVLNKRVEGRVERGFVSAGGAVRVLRVEDNRCVVREVAAKSEASGT